MNRRLPLIGLGIEALVLAALWLHAGARVRQREADRPAIAAVTRLMPGADLSLAGPARHLRFPSIEEPGAAFADAPASFDTDPAGGALAPPTEVYSALAPPEARKPTPQPLGQAPSGATPK
jgi:hypothetical protein